MSQLLRIGTLNLKSICEGLCPSRIFFTFQIKFLKLFDFSKSFQKFKFLSKFHWEWDSKQHHFYRHLSWSSYSKWISLIFWPILSILTEFGNWSFPHFDKFRLKIRFELQTPRYQQILVWWQHTQIVKCKGTLELSVFVSNFLKFVIFNALLSGESTRKLTWYPLVKITISVDRALSGRKYNQIRPARLIRVLRKT